MQNERLALLGIEKETASGVAKIPAKYQSPLSVRSALHELWRAIMAKFTGEITDQEWQAADNAKKNIERTRKQIRFNQMSILAKINPHIDKIMKIAIKHDWEFRDYQSENKLISFTRDGVRINVYYSKMTVGTCLDHPVQGKTQLFRRNVSYALLERIFDNPRVHTPKGYQKLR